MEKDEVIKQLWRDVAGQCTCQKIRQANRLVSRRYDDALKPLGIKGNQFTMLTIISLTDAVTLTRLAEIMGMERTTLIRNLKPLERKGLIVLSDEGYRRARCAQISSEGLGLLAQALPLWREAQMTLKSELGDQDWDIVHQGLGALSAIS